MSTRSEYQTDVRLTLGSHRCRKGKNAENIWNDCKRQSRQTKGTNEGKIAGVVRGQCNPERPAGRGIDSVECIQDPHQNAQHYLQAVVARLLSPSPPSPFLPIRPVLALTIPPPRLVSPTTLPHFRCPAGPAPALCHSRPLHLSHSYTVLDYRMPAPL